MNHCGTPFFDAVRAYGEAGIVPFHTPGHKQGRGAPAEWRSVLGLNTLRLDISDVVSSALYDDNWFEALAAAESMAADALGADVCRFLANGTTSGVHAMIMAAVGAGRTGTEPPVVIARNSHRSVIGGLILADATPVYVQSTFDPTRHVWLPPPPESWEEKLAAHSDAAALLVTYPAYEGVAPDLAAIAAAADQYGVPVLVDEAHGPHFGLHPRLPRRALDMGAEWSAQSPHKLLGSFTQASWLVGRPRRIKADAVSTALGVLQTTSPSALLLASLDVARRQIAVDGRKMMEQALAAADEVRAFVRRLGGVHNVEFSPPRWDETKLLLDVSELGMTGFEAARRLRRAGVQVEMGTSHHVLALATFGDTGETVAAFCRALEQLVKERAPAARPAAAPAAASLPGIPPQVLRPRQAALGRARLVPLTAAVGEVASDIVCPYPPGVPVLCPGEQVSSDVVAYLQDILHSGGEVRGITYGAREPLLRVVAG